MCVSHHSFPTKTNPNFYFCKMHVPLFSNSLRFNSNSLPRSTDCAIAQARPLSCTNGRACARA
eukprot:870071-Pleurochrysis_carterae.AAC.6